jgi:type IV pilus assembly protein PilY1
MKYCFPASPVAIGTSFSYIYDDGGTQKEERLPNVLKCIYVTDIYANIYKIKFNFDVTSTVPGTPPFSLSTGWKVTHIFSGNPGSSSTSGHFGQGTNTDDQGRKTFYPPAVSWGGACNYFDAANYIFPDVDFSGLDGLAVLYFGTGDREHPNYTMIKNRFYAVYDDSSVTAKDSKTHADIPVSSVPYTENNLMNLTCDELDDDTTVSGVTKTDIKTALTDDVTYDNGVTSALENGATHEDDAKGWYIVLADQGDATACSNCSYANADTTDHQGEKVLSSAELYAGVIYFTSYQPSISDPCHPQGNGFFYSLNYCDATPAYGAGGGGSTYHGPRSVISTGILGPPSEPAILTREGGAAAMAMMGGSIKGKDGAKDFKIKSPGYGLELYYWRNSDSQRKKTSGVTVSH